MNRKSIWQRRGMTGALSAALVLAQQAGALACEGCKQAVSGKDGEQVLTAASIGYSLSVSFMLLMVISVTGSLIWMIARSCRALEQAHAAEAQAQAQAERDHE